MLATVRMPTRKESEFDASTNLSLLNQLIVVRSPLWWCGVPREDFEKRPPVPCAQRHAKVYHDHATHA